MRITEKISTTQLAIVISSALFGQYSLTYPKIIAGAAGTAAPLMTVAGTCCAAFSLFVFTRLSQRFSDQTIFDYSQGVIGKFPSLLANILVFACFFMSSALLFRQFGEVLSTVVFRKTPIEMSILMIVVLIAFSCRRNAVKFSYVLLFYWPFVILPFLFVIMMATKSVRPLNLLPLLGNETPKWPQALLSPASLYLGAFIVTVLLPVTEKPRQALKAAMLGIAVTGCLYLLLVVSTIGIYGVQETLQLLYPTLEMARSIAIGGDVIERMDALFIIMWVINVYTTMYTMYYINFSVLKPSVQVARSPSRDYPPDAFIIWRFPASSRPVPTVLHLPNHRRVRLSVPDRLWLVSLDHFIDSAQRGTVACIIEMGNDGCSAC